MATPADGFAAATAALAKLVGQIGGSAALGAFDKFRQKVADVADNLERNAQRVGTALRPLTESLTRFTAEVARLRAAVTDFLSPFTQLARAVSEAAGAIGGAVGAVVGGLVAIGGALVRFAAAVVETAARVAYAIVTLPYRVATGLADFAQRTATAAAGLMGRPLRMVQDFFGAVSGEIASLVGKFQPGAVQRFQLALDGLYAAIGSALVPVLDRFTALAGLLNRHITGLTGEGRNLIAGLIAGAIGMKVFAAAAAMVQSVLTGGLFSAIGAVVGAIGGMAFASGALDGVLSRVAAVVAGVVDRLGAVFSRVASSGAFETVLNAFAEAVEVLVGPMTAGVTAVARMMEAAAPLIIVAARGIRSLFELIVSWIDRVLAYVGAAGVGGPAPAAAPAAVGTAAARSTSTTDVSALLARVRESAFGAGTSPAVVAAVRTADGIRELITRANAIEAAINAAFPSFIAALGRFGERIFETITTALRIIPGT